MKIIGDNIHPHFPDVIIPTPIENMISREVVVMTKLPGVKLIDGILEFYKNYAAKQGMTLEEFKQHKLQETTEKKEAAKLEQPPTAFQMSLFRIWVSLQHYTYNFIATIGLYAT